MNSGLSSAAERNFSKVDVIGSIPIARSNQESARGQWFLGNFHKRMPETAEEWSSWIWAENNDNKDWPWERIFKTIQAQAVLKYIEGVK